MSKKKRKSKKKQLYNPNRALEPYGIKKIEELITWRNNKQKLIVIERGNTPITLEERDTEYKKPNPRLIFIARINKSKIYYNIDSCEFWEMMTKKGSQEVEWNQLEDHDLDSMFCIGLLNQYKFESSEIPDRIRPKKRLKPKIQLFNDRFHQKKRKKR